MSKLLTLCLFSSMGLVCSVIPMEFEEYRLYLGVHIQSIRKSRGLTQEQVAKNIGMDRVSIGYIEQGKRAPKLSTLYALSRCFDVEMQEFFDF